MYIQLKGLYYVQQAFREAASYARWDPYTHFSWQFEKTGEQVALQDTE